jgi:hypothetical protein
MDAFGLLLFAILEPLRILIDVIIDLIGFLAKIIRVFAMVVNVASTVLGVIFAITAAGLSLLKLGLAEAFEGFLNLGVGGTTIGDTLEYLGGLVDSLMSALDVDVMGFLENLLNGFIELVNDLLIGLNKIPGMNVGTVSTVGDSGLEVSEEDVRTNASGAVDQVTGSSPANINVNTDNSTNIDQTVNADPEDKATLSRVVSDAIEEANSFERRRAGSQ